MKVYLAFQGDYEDNHVVGVFAEKHHAQELVTKKLAHSVYDYDVLTAPLETSPLIYIKQMNLQNRGWEYEEAVWPEQFDPADYPKVDARAGNYAVIDGQIEPTSDYGRGGVIKALFIRVEALSREECNALFDEQLAKLTAR